MTSQMCTRPLQRALPLSLVCLLVVLGLATQSDAEEPTLADTTIDELIEELERRGVVGERAEEPPSAPVAAEKNAVLAALLSWFERIDLYGDFRARFEGFVFDTDSLGVSAKDRYGFRYRLRLGAKVDINDYFDVAFRLSTGPDAKSSNQTLGSGVDFDPDGVFVDQAYLTAKPFANVALPLAGQSHVRFGKMPNPFRSKQGSDLIIWDVDIMPEGVAVNYSLQPVDDVKLNLDLGYYIIEEISGRSADPHVLAIQLDSTWQVTSELGVGFTPSFYAYRNLDDAFFERASHAASGFGKSSGGNVPGGLTTSDHIHIADFRGFATYDGLPDWPITVYGNVLENFSAERQPVFAAGKEDLAWSVGVKLGDRQKIVELGAAYFYVEANAVPSNFTDSDIFDGKTNGKGWYLSAARRIFAHTDFKLEAFLSDDIAGKIHSSDVSGDPPETFVDAVKNHDRYRFRADVIVKW